MPQIHRICSRKRADSAFSGEGARQYGGRWNEKGTRVVYCASTVSLAMLEMLVHSPSLPSGMVTIALTLPDDVRLDSWSEADLPSDWAAYPAPASLQARGSAWVASARSLALRVPSAVVRTESNVLVNPGHPDWLRCTIHTPSPVLFDARLRP